MTFYEAALRVLEEAAAPLHAEEITKRAVDKGLLSHVGKTPEVTMLSRLAAMARRTVGRRVMVTAQDTFALTDWMLPEDAEALASTGVATNPEEELPPYRPNERHPEPHAEYLRSIGRQADRKRGRDDDRRKKFPPLPEVAFQLLEECKTALSPGELIARARNAELADDDLSVGALLDALAEDNQKRLDDNRRPAFAAARVDGGELQLSIEPPAPAEGGPSALDLMQTFCSAVNLKFENGRVMLRADRQRHKPAAAALEAPQAVALGDEGGLMLTARHAVRDSRKAVARSLRQRLSDFELGTFEKACVRMLHALHFRELKVSRRSKEGPLLTARRRDGSLELRYAIRLLKGSQQVDRRQVQELKRELSHHGANIGLVISAGEARGESRGEAVAGSNLVLLWCGDGLADKFLEAQVGVKVTTVELFEVDDTFFTQAAKDAEDSQKRREDRQREKEQPRTEGIADAVAAVLDESSGSDRNDSTASMNVDALLGNARDEGDDDEGGEGDEGPEGEGAAASGAEGGAPSEGRRRRRRRRRRRGGPRPEGAPAEGQAAAAGTDAGASAAPAAAAAAPTPPPPAPSPAPDAG